MECTRKLMDLRVYLTETKDHRQLQKKDFKEDHEYHEFD